MDRKEAIEVIKKNWPDSGFTQLREALNTLVPELKESEDEKIRKEIIDYLSNELHNVKQLTPRTNEFEAWIAYLVKRKEQRPEMIQWTGKNLKEVINFTGKSPRFDEWFKSWEEYENYVHSHNNIFKLFCEDGSHYEVPVGSWIVKTPDGFNIPSLFKFVQKHTEWSEEDEKQLNDIISLLPDLTIRHAWLLDIKRRLKSLQPRWTPSEEQMKVLNEVVGDYRAEDTASCEKTANILESLYNDLESL